MATGHRERAERRRRISLKRGRKNRARARLKGSVAKRKQRSAVDRLVDMLDAKLATFPLAKQKAILAHGREILEEFRAKAKDKA